MAEKIKIDSKFDLKNNYEASDSEDEYSNEEKELLSKVRSGKESNSDSEEEVYGFSESESDNADLADSDIEGQEESGDDLPDTRAWGQKKKSFYNADYVDEDFGGFGNDEEAATLEESEARILQKRLTEQLNDEDFSFDFFASKKDDNEKADNESEFVIKTDLTKLSQRQKLQLLKKESPEFMGLINDFKEKMSIAKDFLKPIISLTKIKTLPNCIAINFIEMYYELILNYCTNISFYLLLKAKKISIQNHPITNRLLQFRQILKQIEPIYENSVKPQIDKILVAARNNDDIMIMSTIKNNPKTKLKASKKLKLLNDITDDNIDNFSEDDEPMDFMGTDKEIQQNNSLESNSLITNPMSTEEITEKRAITYQIAKNKGLTPRRKKEQRNPRVKHRNKYRKAQIRRKGAIREVRTEMKRYEGEISGIKSNVKKSIKIK